LCFDLLNPFIQTSLDLRDGFTLAEMSGLFEVLEISAQFQEELVGKTMAHRRRFSTSAGEIARLPVFGVALLCPLKDVLRSGELGWPSGLSSA
jgi:hypothetical protein